MTYPDGAPHPEDGPAIPGAQEVALLQPTFPIAPEAASIHEVLASLRRLRVTNVELEYDLQLKISEQLTADGIQHRREVRLSSGNQIDFLVPGGIGIEVKKGKPNSAAVMAQVDRYCRHDAVTRLVLVVERNVIRHDRSANGKPVHYISLSKLWGIAL